jgi:arylsulfatase
MRRVSLVLLIVAAGALLTALGWLYLREPAPTIADSAEATVPAHYFVSDQPIADTTLECRFTAVERTLWEIWSRPLEPCSLDGGWTGPASWGVWAFGALSTTTFHLDAVDWERLTVRTRAYIGIPEGAEQRLLVELNGAELGGGPVGLEWTDVTIPIPSGMLRVGPNEVVLRFAHRASPAEAGRGKDERPMAAAVEQISLSRPRASSGQGRSQVPVQVFDRRSGRFIIESSGTLVIPTRVPAGAAELVVEARLADGASSAGAELELSVRSIDSSRVEASSLEVADSWLGGATRPARRQIPVAGFEGDLCLVSYTTDLADWVGPIEVSPPRFLLTDVTPQQAPAESAPTRRPDIVLITLDAARRDHFSGYGYSRPTTPSMDRFGERALMFDNAFALAPYTLCSVPTMITGLSFLNHGVISHEHTLSPDATTLAEHLQAAGYRTACFSATPNNSPGKGFEQGYDEFFELWREAGKNTSRKPHYVTRRAVKWLDALDDDRPIHLQIHYIPPHAPYEPESRFNVFADPGYRGPCNGKFKTLSGLETGRIDPADGCLEHVVNLYDGNLLAADDAVGKLLAALRSRDRWRDTVVLITSDHGEAFLEHGRMHHNSTVYDEMLAVPFILRVPPWIHVDHVDTRRLVTLADIVPTLLGTAGIRTGGALDGVDLLSTDPGDASASRFLVAGNTDKPPLLGLRTLHWKAILTPSGQGWLYDLDRDPAETHSLVFEDRSVFAGLSLLLTERATAPRSLVPASETAEITDADREMLRALGYLDAADSD